MYATQTKKERRDRITFYKGGERQGRITFYKGGNRCVLDFENKSGKAPRSSFHGGLKAPTYGLSDAARSYMRDLLSQLDSDELVTAGIFWIRLSVPKKLWDEGFKRVKDHQKRLFKKIQRRYGDLGCIWRLELANKDGGFSPHIHVIMIFPGASSSCLRKFIEDTWPASTRTVRVNSSRYLDRIKRYIAKKERITETHTGKAWGIFCKEMVDSFIHPKRRRNLSQRTKP